LHVIGGLLGDGIGMGEMVVVALDVRVGCCERRLTSAAAQVEFHHALREAVFLGQSHSSRIDCGLPLSVPRERRLFVALVVLVTRMRRNITKPVDR
jgi:hypothetical protein